MPKKILHFKLQIWLLKLDKKLHLYWKLIRNHFVLESCSPRNFFIDFLLALHKYIFQRQRMSFPHLSHKNGWSPYIWKFFVKLLYHILSLGHPSQLYQLQRAKISSVYSLLIIWRSFSCLDCLFSLYFPSFFSISLRVIFNISVLGNIWINGNLNCHFIQYFFTMDTIVACFPVEIY